MGFYVSFLIEIHHHPSNTDPHTAPEFQKLTNTEQKKRAEAVTAAEIVAPLRLTCQPAPM